MRYKESEGSAVKRRLRLLNGLDEAKGTIENMKEVIEDLREERDRLGRAANVVWDANYDLRKQLAKANKWHKVDMKAVRDKNLILELARARRVTQIDTLTRRNEWQARRIDDLEDQIEELEDRRDAAASYPRQKWDLTRAGTLKNDETLTVTFTVT